MSSGPTWPASSNGCARGTRSSRATSRTSATSSAASATRRSTCSIGTSRSGADNRLALIWEGENFETRFFTYRMLAIEVNKCANVLKQLGVGKGDAVAIFTPNLAETVIAVLACFRIGAHLQHGLLRILDALAARSPRGYEPKVVITANYGLPPRRRVFRSRRRVDEAIEGLPSVSAVVVIRRAAAPTPMRAGPRPLVARPDGCARRRDCPPSRWKPTSPASCSTPAARPASRRASSIRRWPSSSTTTSTRSTTWTITRTTSSGARPTSAG